jgi:hypothetical protein
MFNSKKLWIDLSFVMGIFLFVFFQAKCATIIHGTTQEISVNSQPSEADVVIKGVKMAKTSALIKLARKDSNIVLRLEKEGYEPVEIAIKRSTDAWIAGNIIFGGIIGLVIDFVNGAAYKLSPEVVQVELKKHDISLNEGSGDAVVIAIDLESNKNIDKKTLIPL